MLQNEKGNSLITVLLVSLVFTTLGLSILASTIGGAKRVEIRESETTSTYKALEYIDKITTDLTLYLNTTNPNNLSLNNKLENLINKTRQDDKHQDGNVIKCMNIVDLSKSSPELIDKTSSCIDDLSNLRTFDIDTTNDFTRAYEIIIVTQNPNDIEGDIERTIRKRIFVSPLPSFLKYAVGSSSEDDGKGLLLNGSPNIVGNVFANNLTIEEQPNYQLRDGTIKEGMDSVSTPLPSIVGEIYSSSANILEDLKDADRFYKGEIPDLGHDSQFVDINFLETLNKSANIILADIGLNTIRSTQGVGFSDDLKNEINSLTVNDMYTTTNVPRNGISAPTSLTSESGINLTGSFLMEDKSKPLTFDHDMKIKDGDLVIRSTNFPITINSRLIVDRDLYIVSHNDIDLSNILVGGTLHIINLDGTVTINGSTIAAKTINVETAAKASGDGVTFNGDILTGTDLSFRVNDTSLKVNKNIVVNRSFNITGNEDDTVDGDHEENDEVVFDSVVYAGGSSFVSNVNILGANNNEKQLILLTNKELVITRINEFNNFDPLSENGLPYLPESNSNIKPLRAFFYTEERAELYGVGSLFYINGGIFAKETLEINAVRGEVNDIDELHSASFQDDKLSRFIVDYNKDVLLQKIDALPVVDHLQLISDELIVE